MKITAQSNAIFSKDNLSLGSRRGKKKFQAGTAEEDLFLCLFVCLFVGVRR